jgi:hypothetical protein
MNGLTPQPNYNFFENAPMAAAILDADTLKVEVVNQPMLDLWDRNSSITGLRLLDFLPELVDQDYPKLLRRVAMSGKAHKDSGALVWLERNNKKESVFMDYSYTPIAKPGYRPNGIMVLATDVCERELNRLIIKQSERDLRALVMSAPVPMCIFRDAKFKIEAVNNLMLDLWQGTQKMNLCVLNHVFHNGVPYTICEEGITYTYTPLWSGINVISGVCLIAAKK